VTNAGALGYGYIIGAVSGIVATRNQRRNLFYTTMDTLNEYMTYMNITGDLQPRLRDYFKYKMKQVGRSHPDIPNFYPNWRAATSGADPMQWQDWFLKCLRLDEPIRSRPADSNPSPFPDRWTPPRTRAC
jgi:hypothetical protein